LARWGGDAEFMQRRLHHAVYNKPKRANSAWVLEGASRHMLVQIMWQKEFWGKLYSPRLDLGSEESATGHRRDARSSSKYAWWGNGRARRVIVVSIMDLDELPTRENYIYWKYCRDPAFAVRVVPFRYDFTAASCGRLTHPHRTRKSLLLRRLRVVGATRRS
jgi:hypothetical protein